MEWLEHAQAALLFLLGEDVLDPKFKVLTSADPIKVNVTIALRQPISKASREPLRNYLRAWAKIGNCDVPRIIIDDRGVFAEVLTKQRVWRQDDKSKFGPHRGPR